jgi:hypothetical protein
MEIRAIERRRKEKLFSHIPGPPKIPKVLPSRQMSRRHASKEILSSRISYVNHYQLLERKTTRHFPENKAKTLLLFLRG